MDLLNTLVEKFPTFDPNWAEAAQQSWFAGFDRLLALAAKTQPPQPEQPATPAAEPPQNGKANGHVTISPYARRVGDEELATLRRLHAEGKSDSEIARLTGTGQSTVSKHLRRMGLEPHQPFRPGGAVGHGDS